MATPPLTCPRCGAPLVPGGAFCQSCGVPLATAVPPGGAPLPSAPPVAPPPPAGFPPPYSQAAPYPPGPVSYNVADRERTATGLLLLVIGFVLAWIPYIDFIGDILVLVGVILIILGRRGFGPDHQRNVVVGGLLFFLTILVTVGLVVWFAAALFSQAGASGASLSSVGAALNSDLAVLFVGAAVIGVVGGLAQVIIPYALSDRETRILLWAGYLISIALSLVILWVLYPQIATAVNQATSGLTFNNAPIASLETTSTLLGLSKAIPSLLFAWAYWRARESAMARF